MQGKYYIFIYSISTFEYNYNIPKFIINSVPSFYDSTTFCSSGLPACKLNLINN